MKRILMKLMLLCATAPALTSCIDDDYEGSTASGKDTYIHLNVSTAALQTRASDESAANPNTESDIHSVRVWAFNSDLTDDGVLPVSYKEETNLEKNSQYTFSMKIPRNSGGTELKNLDLFILANAESGSKLYGDAVSPKELTRQKLQEAKLSDKFIINSDGKPTDTTVPETGLPISRYVTGINVDEYKSESESATGKALEIPMQRAVSKLHFFFARKDETYMSQAEVTKIELDGGNLSTGSYVFPDGAQYANLSTEGMKKTNGTQEYISGKTVLDGISGANIKPVSKPEEYVRGDEEDASDYLSRLATAGITSQDLAYYNETDKPISGTIYYKVYSTGEERSASFSIPAEYNSRNHELLVYGYFNGEGHLELNYAILDWDQTASTTVETKDLTYLNVYPTLVFMRNVNTNNEVNFFASNTCTVSIEEVYYYDKNNTKQTITSGSQYPSVDYDTNAKQGTIKITSTLPDENVANNLTVKYIKLKVKLNDSDKYEEVLVKQYPLEYAQNVEGKYSSRSTSGWVSDKENGGTYRDHYNSRTGYYGYTAKIYSGNTIHYYKGGSNIGEMSGNSNRYMYVIQITSTNGEYTIAHPNLKSDGSSDDNVVSPAFMIASQLGTVYSSGFNETTAISHCQTYREVATDGTIYDKWRLPTNAEVGIIIEYQGEKNSPIADVLTGQYYRTLSKGTAGTGFNDRDSQGTFVRCVRDLSPKEVTKLENSKK